MARINLSDVGKFSNSGNSEFLTLKDDGDVARVRFLYDDPNGEDMDFYLVHEVMIGEKKRYVGCIGINDTGACPLCLAGHKKQEKLFLQVYDEDEEKLKLWERGKTFVPKIVTYINRYKSLVSQPIEIERKGKKGDQRTTYELFPLEKDDKTLEDFPPKQQIEGTFVLKATSQDMEDMLSGIYKLPTSEETQGDTTPSDTQRQGRDRDRGSRRRDRVQDAF